MNKITIVSLVVAGVAVIIAGYLLISRFVGGQAGTAVGTRPISSTSTISTGITQATTYKTGDIILGSQQTLSFPITNQEPLALRVTPVITMTSGTQGVIVAYRVDSISGAVLSDAAKSVGTITSATDFTTKMNKVSADFLAKVEPAALRTEIARLSAAVISELRAKTVVLTSLRFVPVFTITDSIAGYTPSELNIALKVVNEALRRDIMLITN
jgi:hypothetical protein